MREIGDNWKAHFEGAPRNQAGRLFHAPATPASPALFPNDSELLCDGSGGFPGGSGVCPKACGKRRSRRGACLDHSGKLPDGRGLLPSRRGKLLNGPGKRLNRRGGVRNRCGKLLSRPDKLLKGRENGKTLKNRQKKGTISRKGAKTRRFRDFNPPFFLSSWCLGMKNDSKLITKYSKLP